MTFSLKEQGRYRNGCREKTSRLETGPEPECVFGNKMLELPVLLNSCIALQKNLTSTDTYWSGPVPLAE